ncbi:MAG: putative 4-hydroxybenzoate polyprenyltransferase [Rikenellaceae bacterium]|nr:putative 4-hydroxybenzoate polyprenyltransferase [Rikenellaceae bacterium]MBR2443223.1 putative 4-hydroxybenzoate polyprenyltransferase [Rikenellaceae bacterium]
MTTIRKYMSMVKFSHTIFAMPFALVGYTYALTSTSAEFDWVLLLQVVLCMVFARNTAMGFNRWADRDIDAENPRTAMREIPSGQISPRAALIFVVVNALLFVVTAATINRLTLWLSPVALFVVMGYSLAKRFTALAHIILGLALAIAPTAAYIAVTGEFAVAPVLLSGVVLTWVSGFDIIYAMQDAEFDRQRGLHSIPARFPGWGALIISIALHAVCLAMVCWFGIWCEFNWLFWVGVAIFGGVLTLEHLLVTPTRQTNIGIAFGTLNGIASLVFATFAIASMLL